MEQMGRLLVVVGAVIVVVGLTMMFGRKLPLDIHYQRENFTFYFPLGTSILISVVLTLILTLLNRR